MNSTEFRKQVVKIMPGYSWTVHRADEPDKYISATGIQSSGFNRLSTVKVQRWEKDGVADYKVSYAGNGANAQWLAEMKGATLARAFRHMQEYFEAMARTYTGAANDLQGARKA